MDPRRTAAATLVLALLGTTFSVRTWAAECNQAIPENTAKSVFARLGPIHESDGCTLENVDTQRTEMRIRFRKGSKDFSDVVVVAKSCAAAGDVSGKAFAYAVPAELASACPATMTAVRTAFDEDAFGGTIHVDPSAEAANQRKWLLVRWIGTGVLLALLAAAIVYGRKKRAATPA